jgi:hydrogenase maturation factor
MAAVAGTVVVERQPMGQYEMVVVRTSALGTAAANEWIAAKTLRAGRIVAILGCVGIGATALTGHPNFTKNAQGTGVAEGTNMGDLGVEVVGAGDNVLEITLLVVP